MLFKYGKECVLYLNAYILEKISYR